MNYDKLFTRLNEKLSENDIHLSLQCVGGFVLEYHGLKATEDIDAFYESTSKVEEIIAEIGQEFHVGTVNEPWLSHSIGQIMSFSEQDRVLIFKASHLDVYLSSLQSVLIDKIQAGREKDVPDIAQIMKKLKIKSPDTLLDLLEDYSEGTSDPAVVLEAYSIAYGKEALKNYLREKPELLRLL
ncbi:DUF6036 family nucleotidyltransferase [Lactococcus ileimucosae]|uniref:DUF6036 family nucleotidyltransferase n=1 Tax=Lactococcus ileimucosae TaxID=2941329 RepID=A0ABV4D312_9LACT|nr:DUF6036 family nucleotidyltransferase [Lactococcus ileimucosae]